MEISERIKTIRKEKGITQQQLAKDSKIPLITIKKYEAGTYNPGADRIRIIANALGVSPFDIAGAEYFDDLTNLSDLLKEVQLAELLDELYSKEAVQTINDFLSLNSDGQKMVSDYIDLLIPKYQEKNTHSH